MRFPTKAALRRSLGPLAPLAERLPDVFRIPLGAYLHFSAGDGWAIASHIALSTLMSLFPFLIVVTALAGFVGSRDAADAAGRILLETWPAEVADPIAREIRRVLTTSHGDVLTVGVVFAVYFASSGIESLRIGLNRAYEVAETRNWWLLRLESIFYVIVSAVALLVLAVLVVLGPVIIAAATRQLQWLTQFEPIVTIARFAIATVILAVTLVLVHRWLPAGRRRFGEIVPGVLVTLVLWLVSGAVFGRYLAASSERYVLTYAGLASVMIALVFLYLSAAIFIYGGELNAAIMRVRRAQKKPELGSTAKAA